MKPWHVAFPLETLSVRAETSADGAALFLNDAAFDSHGSSTTRYQHLADALMALKARLSPATPAQEATFEKRS